jgi:hypothetical protein
MPNRHERRRTQATVGRIEIITPEKAQEYLARGRGCCFRECVRTYTGEQPKGWQNILIFHARKTSLDLGTIEPKDWSRDGVLCPEHVEAVQGVLTPLGMEVAELPSEGNA